MACLYSQSTREIHFWTSYREQTTYLHHLVIWTWEIWSLSNTLRKFSHWKSPLLDSSSKLQIITPLEKKIWESRSWLPWPPIASGEEYIRSIHWTLSTWLQRMALISSCFRNISSSDNSRVTFVQTWCGNWLWN